MSILTGATNAANGSLMPCTMRRCWSAWNAVSAKHMVDLKARHDIPDREGLWKNYEYFAKAVMPEAEKAGIKLIVHPSDPPLREVAGVERIFIDPADFARAEKICNSEAFGINFCIGTFWAVSLR